MVSSIEEGIGRIRLVVETMDIHHSEIARLKSILSNILDLIDQSMNVQFADNSIERVSEVYWKMSQSSLQIFFRRLISFCFPNNHH